jgi:DNA-binding NarL/FixJ family response regulator
MTPIKVVLIDDHYLIHEAVAHQLAGQEDIILAAGGAAGEEIEPLIEAHQPDIVLIDLNIPRRREPPSGKAGTSRFSPPSAICAKSIPKPVSWSFSGTATLGLLEGALDAGASGYLLKDDELSLQLPDALRAVHRGGLYFSREAGRHFFKTPAAVEPPVPALTPRQLEVLRAILQNTNLTDPEHARRMVWLMFVICNSFHALQLNGREKLLECLALNVDINKSNSLQPRPSKAVVAFLCPYYIPSTFAFYPSTISFDKLNQLR